MSMIVVAATFAVHASPAQATTQTAPNVTPATLTVTAGQTFHDAALAPDGTWFVGTDTGLLAFPRTQAGGLGTSPAPVTWSDPVTSTSRSVADAVAVRPDGDQIAVAFAERPDDPAIIAIYDLPLTGAAPVRVLRGPSLNWLWDIRSMAWDGDGNLYALGWIDGNGRDYWWGVSVFAPSTGENDQPARIIEAIPTSTGREGANRDFPTWSAITVDGARNLIIGHAATFDGLTSGYLRVPLGLDAQEPVDRLAGPVGRFVTTADGTLFNLSGATLTAWDAGARWTEAPTLTVSGMPTGTFSALGAPSTGSSLEVLTYSSTQLKRYTYPITSRGNALSSISLPTSPAAAPSVTLGDITGEPRTGVRLHVNVTTATGLPEPSGIITWQSAASASGPWTTIEDVSGNWYEPSASDAGRYLRASITLSNSEGSADATSSPVGPIRPEVVGSRTQLYQPHATAVDSRGRVYAANHTRWVTVHAQAGNVAPVAILDAPDGASDPLGISVDSQDRVWVAFNNCTIARYPALGASPAARIAADRSWQVPRLALPGSSGCRGVVPTADGSAFWASNSDTGTLGRFSATGPSGTLIPERILSGLYTAYSDPATPWGGPWGLTLDPAGNVVIAANGYRVLAVTPNAGFIPQPDDTSANWAAWDEGWMAWQIIGLQSAQAAVRRADGSTVIVAQGSPSIPFLQVLPPGAADDSNPLLSLTTSTALPFMQLAGFSVSPDGSTAIVPSKLSALILPITLANGTVPGTWLAGSAVGQSGGYLRSISLSPSEPETSPSPPSPSETPATTPSAPAAPTSPTVASAPPATATAQAPAAAVSGPASSGATPNASPSMSTQVQRIQISSSASPGTAPVVRTLGSAPLALAIVDFPPGSTVRTTLRRPSGNAVVRQVRVGSDGTLQLPTKRLSRPGRYLVTLTDDSGTRRYVAIVVQRSGRR